jgi:thiopeptide-type bacteriocin biosynthesis protein
MSAEFDTQPVADGQRIAQGHEQLYDGLEILIKNYLKAQGDCQEPSDQRDLGEIVERTGAAIERLLSESAGTEQWLYLRVSVPDGAGVALIAHEMAPLFDQLRSDAAIHGWWWLNKHDPSGPALRVRILIAPRMRAEIEKIVAQQLARLQRDFRVLRYEPELRLFGGSEGMAAAHDHFCADSAFLAAWAQCEEPLSRPIIPEGLSLAFIFHMLRASGLDLFEQWDVFDRVYDKREIGGGGENVFPFFQKLAAKVVGARPDRIFELYGGQKARLINRHRDFLEGFGYRTGSTYFEGRLDCGLREFFVPIILFHWNRIGMNALRQSGLSCAASKELARLSRKGRSGGQIGEHREHQT